MTPFLVVVGLLILAALVFAVGMPRARSRRTVVVERARPVQRVVETQVVQTPVVQTPVVPVVQTPVAPVVQTPVVQTPVVQTPVVEEIADDRF